MPTDACLFFHECNSCHTLLRPKVGDCCVFCSYGSVPCPPIQAGGSCTEQSGACCGTRDAVGEVIIVGAAPDSPQEAPK